MTRRRFLKSFTLLAILAGYTAILWRSKWVRYKISDIIKPRINPSSGTGILSNKEKETIIAFAEVLVKGSGMSTEEKQYTTEHIDYRTKGTPGYLSTYRITASLLNRLTKNQFSTLDIKDRIPIVLRHDLLSHKVHMWEYLNPFRRETLAIRAFIVPDILRGFYSSPAGWSVVGYKIFPGLYSNLFRYTHSEV